MRLENRMDPVDDIKESDREIPSRDAANDAGDIVDLVDPGREIPVLVLRERVLGGRAVQKLVHRSFSSDLPARASVRASKADSRRGSRRCVGPSVT